MIINFLKELRLQSLPLLLVIVLQILCSFFFFYDAINDIREATAEHTGYFESSIELIASVVLLVAVWYEVRFQQSAMKRKAVLEESIRKTQLSLNDLIFEKFDSWGLSPAENEVALFLFKGLNAKEISDARGTSEGTVKAQLSSIYRKAGAHNRADLVLGVVDTLYARDVEQSALATPGNGSVDDPTHDEVKHQP